jgi:hypothetical protein
LTFAVIGMAGGCSENAAGPNQSVVLRTDPTTIHESSQAAIHPVQVFLSNQGATAIHVALCAVGGPNPPTAMLTQQVQDTDGAWIVSAPYVLCADPSSASDQAIAPHAELLVGRLRPANQSGVYRYLLSYANADGTTAMAVSAPYTVIYDEP